MNADQMKGSWKQLKGKVKEQWGKLTDDDLTVINGQQEQLVGKLRSTTATPRSKPKRNSSVIARLGDSSPTSSTIVLNSVGAADGKPAAPFFSDNAVGYLQPLFRPAVEVNVVAGTSRRAALTRVTFNECLFQRIAGLFQCSRSFLRTKRIVSIAELLDGSCGFFCRRGPEVNDRSFKTMPQPPVPQVAGGHRQTDLRHYLPNVIAKILNHVGENLFTVGEASSANP